jgi:hypothetical protein
VALSWQRKRLTKQKQLDLFVRTKNLANHPFHVKHLQLLIEEDCSFNEITPKLEPWK